MTTKHKHYDCIIAWANGAKIQIKESHGWEDIPTPSFVGGCEYRVKPEKKEPFILTYISVANKGFFSKGERIGCNIILELSKTDSTGLVEFEEAFKQWLKEYNEKED